MRQKYFNRRLTGMDIRDKDQSVRTAAMIFPGRTFTMLTWEERIP